jgi:hypothetical protein
VRVAEGMGCWRILGCLRGGSRLELGRPRTQKLNLVIGENTTLSSPWKG